ncbi:glycosyltransferase family 2 protein [Massilia glaciei]|uniref:Glycosyltransferase family 2 protein n=1 Tax=Massilia glaciei TaxID=1524097 RepID=A0A2U2HEA1_9BURK|nr:glycosyltransferase family 2 protein [Massilia glaciei]
MIPVYDHEHAIKTVAARVLAHGLPLILVDDGSDAACAHALDQLAAAAPERVTLVRLARNQGKGGAVLSGLRHAAGAGFTHMLQIDADGQHRTDDIPAFVALARAQPHALIVGCPVYDESVPKLRLYARYLTHVWVWINTLSFDIRDSMCGFRVYPIAPVMALAARRKLGLRMNFDTDVLVRLYWDGLRVVNVPTRVGYPSDGVSHFRMWRDNVLITRMHATLLCGMLLRLPVLLARKWRRR